MARAKDWYWVEWSRTPGGPDWLDSMSSYSRTWWGYLLFLVRAQLEIAQSWRIEGSGSKSSFASSRVLCVVGNGANPWGWRLMQLAVCCNVEEWCVHEKTHLRLISPLGIRSSSFVMLRDVETAERVEELISKSPWNLWSSSVIESKPRFSRLCKGLTSVGSSLAVSQVDEVVNVTINEQFHNWPSIVRSTVS